MLSIIHILLAATIGTKSLEQGFHLNIAHIDSPRLDLRPVPEFAASTHFSRLMV